MKKRFIILLLSFCITNLYAQEAIDLYFPKDNHFTSDDSLVFHWTTNESWSYFNIQLSNDPVFGSTIEDIDNITVDSVKIDIPVAPGQIYWRVRYFDGLTYSAWSNAKSFVVFRAGLAGNCYFWLSADTGLTVDGTNNVSSWADRTQNHFNYSQSIPAQQPLLIPDSLNSYPVVSFTDDYLRCDSVMEIKTMFFVSNFNGLGTFPGNNSLFTPINYGSAGDIHFRGKLGQNYLISNGYFGNGIFINGIQTNVFSPLLSYKLVYGQKSSGTESFDGYVIGSQGVTNLYWIGGVAEIIAFSDVLSATKIDSVSKYLSDKYAPPLDLGPDIYVPHSLCDTSLTIDPSFSNVLWSTSETTQSITISESGIYTVQATNLFGRACYDTIYVQLPSLSLPDTAFCLTDTVTMNTGLDHAYTFQWNDASSDSLLEVFAPGTYWVEVTDSTLATCSVRDTFVVAVDSFPVLASLGPDTSLCAGDRYSLQSELGAGYSYNWSTGSSDSAIVISAPGSYSLTVTNYNVCTAIDTVNIVIKGIKPVAVFSNGTVCLGDSTDFIDMSFTLAPDGINNILFDFNDGYSSTASNPYHTFASNGDFMVTLEVISDSGCYADTTISVHVRDLPSADFLPFNGCNGKLINFSDSSDEAEGSIALWEWDFGDGNTSTVQNPSHAFDTVNMYYTTLIINDIYGCTDTVINAVNVRLTPVADFDYDESCYGESTYFTELTDIPTYSPIIYRQWAFGDGNYSLLQNPQHVYGAVGTYNVLLINKSINGCIDSVEKTITVHPFPIAGFISDTACKNKEVCFIDTSSVQYSSIVLRQWNFDVAGTNTGDSIACTSFPDEGVFPVQLIVTSESGCTSSVTKQIIVHPNPVADFSVIPEYGVPPLDVQFYNYTTGADTWYWIFGDGGNSSSENPAHTYTTENIFDVYLIAENEFTCTDTAYGNVYVIPSQLDLVLNNITVTDSGGYYYLSIEFFNNGTRNIKDIAFDARIGNNIPVHESWSNLLLPGEQSYYTFTAAFLKPDNENIRTICVEGTVLDAYGQEDETPEDNTICYSLIDEFFIASVYPSPANDYITVNIFLPDDGDLNLIINTEDGKIVREGSFFDLDGGTLRARINVQNLAGGMYIIRAKYMDKEDMIKFVKE